MRQHFDPVRDRRELEQLERSLADAERAITTAAEQAEIARHVAEAAYARVREAQAVHDALRARIVTASSFDDVRGGTALKVVENDNGTVLVQSLRAGVSREDEPVASCFALAPADGWYGVIVTPGTSRVQTDPLPRRTLGTYPDRDAAVEAASDWVSGFARGTIPLPEADSGILAWLREARIAHEEKYHAAMPRAAGRLVLRNEGWRRYLPIELAAAGSPARPYGFIDIEQMQLLRSGRDGRPTGKVIGILTRRPLAGYDRRAIGPEGLVDPWAWRD